MARHVLAHPILLQCCLALVCLRIGAQPSLTKDIMEQISLRKLTSPMTGEHRRTSFLTPLRERRLAWVNHGDLSRFRHALDRYKQGQNLTVAVIGGSIAAGAGGFDAHCWTEWLEDWLVEKYGSQRMVFNNGAVPGTTSSYMSMCHNVHVPRLADIIIVEYTINDANVEPGPPYQNPTRRGFERLLRKLLNYPNKPAILIYNSYSWWQEPIHPGLFYVPGERDFYEYAAYYSLPFVSVKAGIYHLMRKGVHGFNVSLVRTDRQGRIIPELDPQVKGKVFYYDPIHPDGWTGHVVMAELIEQVFMDVQEGLAAKPVSQEDVIEPLPPPMITGNYESISDKCFIGELFQACVTDATGWVWKNDVPAGRKPKFGYIAHTPGTTMTLRVDTSVAANQIDNPVAVSMEVAYLKSYHHMGMAEITCVSGCTCERTIIDGHHEQKTSLLMLQHFMVTQAKECIIKIIILQNTHSNGHKVKLSGIMVSEEAGAAGRFGNNAAVEYVHNAVQNGVFKIENTFR